MLKEQQTIFLCLIKLRIRLTPLKVLLTDLSVNQLIHCSLLYASKKIIRTSHNIFQSGAIS